MVEAIFYVLRTAVAWRVNRLTAIVYHLGTNAGNHTEFAYDGISRRVQIVERTGTTIGSGTIDSTKNYLWIGSEMAEERDASNNVTKRFFAQGEQQAGTNYYYTRDHLGSVREMLNSSGSIVARYSYDPYGRTTLVSGSNLATKQYAKMYMHQPSGLYLTEYRALDASTGGWLSRDPMGEDGGVDLYGYVADDPIDLTDILGLAPCCNWTLSIGHGHVPGTMPAVPNTNNSYFEKHGNACTAYTGCGSNALNKGGLGGDLTPNKTKLPSETSQGDDLVREKDAQTKAYADLGVLISKATEECKKSQCKEITITVVCQTGGPDPQVFQKTGLCGQTFTIPCKK
jgi:RHS repeat-associated protein